MNADWTSATLALVNSLPERDPDGNIIPSPVGGRRRIDFLLFRKEDEVVNIFQSTDKSNRNPLLLNLKHESLRIRLILIDNKIDF